MANIARASIFVFKFRHYRCDGRGSFRRDQSGILALQVVLIELLDP